MTLVFRFEAWIPRDVNFCNKINIRFGISDPETAKISKVQNVCDQDQLSGSGLESKLELEPELELESESELELELEPEYLNM